jgi:hypothetical protein
MTIPGRYPPFLRSCYAKRITLSPLLLIKSHHIPGSEPEQEHQLSLCDNFEPKVFLLAHSKDLNTITASARIQQRKEAALVGKDGFTADVVPLSSSTLANKASAFSTHDRKTMEEERLARLGKRKRDSQDGMAKRVELSNAFEGNPHAWQLGESADDFIKRVPPATTSALTCSWIWVSNPRRNSRDESAGPRIAEFTERGSELMRLSLQTRQDLQAKGRFGSKSTVTRALNQEGKALHQRLSDLAMETNVFSGKVLNFGLTCVLPLTCSPSGCYSPKSRMSHAYGKLLSKP